jgi:VanZ family protein
MRLALAWAPAVAVAALIFWLSAIPGLSVTTGTEELILRKGAHFCIYAVLAMACWRGMGFHGLTGRRRIGAAWLLAVAYAITDELHQISVPTRVGSPWDVAVDAAGAACGLAVLLFLLARVRRPLRQALSR